MRKMQTVLIPKYGRLGEGFSRQEKLKAQEHPGRRTDTRGYQSPVSWIERLAAHKNGIILCAFCRSKVNPRKDLKYRQRLNFDGKGELYSVNGQCDWCKQPTQNMGGGVMFIAEETWSKNSMRPEEGRRLPKQRWRTYNDMQKMNEIAADMSHNPDKYGMKHSFKIIDRRRIK